MDRPLSGGGNVKCGIDNVPDTVTHEAAVGLSNRIGIVVARIYQKRKHHHGIRGGKEQEMSGIAADASLAFASLTQYVQRHVDLVLSFKRPIPDSRPTHHRHANLFRVPSKVTQ